MSLKFNGTTVENVVYNGTALCKLVYNGTLVWENHAYGSWTTTTPATCTTAGSKKRTCSRTNCGVSETATIAATGHSWNSPTYRWDGYTSVEATRKCKNDTSHVETATSYDVSSSVTTPATCTAAGVRTYTATFSESWANTSGVEITAPVDATGHSWNTARYLWSGYSSCTATRTCANDSSHTETSYASISSSVTTPATCTSAGVKTYYAAFDPGSTWATTQTKTQSIAATGHSYGTPTYSWSGTSSCTATRTCSYDSSHKETATTTSITSAVTTQPTYTTTGVRTYTATFSESWAGTATKTETIAKLKYSITYDLTGCTLNTSSALRIGAGETVTAKFTPATCYALPDGVVALNAATTVTNATRMWSKDLNNSGNTADGEVAISSDYVLNISNPTGNVTVKFACVPNHTWGGWDTVIAADCQNEGEEKRTCSVCGAEETQVIPKEVHSWIDATCTSPKHCEYCGITEGSTTEHTSSDWIVTKAATTQSAGTRVKKCTVCGEVLETETIAKLPTLTYELDSSGAYTVYATDTYISGDITIPSNYNGKPVKWIGDSAFYGCTGITGITIPSSIVYIDTSAFEGCTGLVSVSIGSGVTHIYSYAFCDCSNLATIFIPDSVIYIGEGAFSGCSSLVVGTFAHKYWRAGTQGYFNIDSTSTGAYFLRSQWVDYAWHKFYAPVVAAELGTAVTNVDVTIQNKNAVALTAKVDAEFYISSGNATHSTSISVPANGSATCTVSSTKHFDDCDLEVYFTALSDAITAITVEGTGSASGGGQT